MADGDVVAVTEVVAIAIAVQCACCCLINMTVAVADVVAAADVVVAVAIKAATHIAQLCNDIASYLLVVQLYLCTVFRKWEREKKREEIIMSLKLLLHTFAVVRKMRGDLQFTVAYFYALLLYFVQCHFKLKFKIKTDFN